MKVLRYVTVGLIGAVIGGYVVVRATGALPKVMSGFMSQMMERMDPEQRERCREMMARFQGNGHRTEPVEPETTQESTATPAT
jgi:uncharacterized membrane protein